MLCQASIATRATGSTANPEQNLRNVQSVRVEPDSAWWWRCCCYLPIRSHDEFQLVDIHAAGSEPSDSDLAVAATGPAPRFHDHPLIVEVQEHLNRHNIRAVASRDGLLLFFDGSINPAICLGGVHAPFLTGEGS